MPTSKTRKYARKTAKKYEFVTFETSIFEGEFRFPSPKHLPLKVMTAVSKSDIEPLITWLHEAKVDPEAIEAFETLDGEELAEFMSAWTDGEISAPKSSK